MLVKKRGQIAIFFMVGIVLLLILLIAIFFRSKTIKIEDAVVIPPALMPAKNYIDFCFDQAVQDSLYVFGRQGGFIDIPDPVKYDPSRRLSFGYGAEMIPYWYYDNMVWVPSIEYMEEDLTNDIGRRFMECVDAISFEYNGFSIKPLDTKAYTRVSINDKDISVEVNYPMEVSTLDGHISTRLSRFYSIYDVRLKDMISLAEDILDYENEYYFLENMTIALMSISDDIPFSDMIIECGTRTWYISDIKRELQLMLLDTLPETRVRGTDYYPFQADEELYADYQNYSQSLIAAYEEVSLSENFEEPKDYEDALNAAASGVEAPTDPLPDDAYYYFHNYMPIQVPPGNSYQNFSVDFLYFPEYGMDIVADPSSDGILKSNSIKGYRRYLSFFCINQFHFSYDITYPIVVSINDPDAYKGQGYTFRYSFPVLIRNNEGIRSRQNIDYVRTNRNFDTYCWDNGGRKVIIKAYDDTCGAACYESVDDVNISMICANRKCPLGQTDGSSGVALLRTNITDSCSNPYIVAEKEGYLPTVYLFESENEELIEIKMIKMKNFTVELKSHMLNPADKKLGAAQTVTQGMVSVYLAGFLGENVHEDAVVLLEGEKHILQLPIYTTQYDLSLTYLKDGQDFSGGYYTVWNVTKEQLLNSNTIVFHMMELLPSTLEEDAAESIAVMDNITSPMLNPEFK